MIIADSISQSIQLRDVMIVAYLRLLLASGFKSSLAVSSLVSIAASSSPVVSARVHIRKTAPHI